MAESAKRMSILVCDDESTLRAVLTQVLREDGHEVTSAASGEEGLALFRSRPFAIVLTDIVMGGMNGLDLLREIKLIDPDAVVILMTSHATLEGAVKAVQSGAFDFLTKPFDDISLVSGIVARAAERVEQLRERNTTVAHLKRTTEELESLNQHLHQIATHDSMTGLFNHRHFRDCLETEIRRSQRHGHAFSLIFMDVDKFKIYNDTHGHLKGDNLLRALASLLQGHCRTTSVLARYGGEEFVLLTPETPTEGGLVCAERIRRSIEDHPFDGGASQPGGRLTMSLGVAAFPVDGTDSDSLIAAADQALYRAKREGRNRVVVAGDNVLTPQTKR